MYQSEKEKKLLTAPTSRAELTIVEKRIVKEEGGEDG
jgi:hypothetical protein